MFTRRVCAALTLALLLIASSFQGSAVTQAHDVAPGHYNAACGSGQDSNFNSQYYVQQTGGAYRNVKATTNIVNLFPCAPAGIVDSGWSLVNAVNFLASGASGQFGYARETCSSYEGCQNGFPDGITEFWWTPTDNSLVIYPATWVDLNGGGHDRPVAGERYSFEIYRGLNNYGDNVWWYCVTVVSSSRFSTGASDCTWIWRNITSYMTLVWYGAETYNDASALGPKYFDTRLDMTPMQYKVSGTDSSYHNITNKPACAYSGDLPIPEGYHCNTHGGAGTTEFDPFTSYHP